MKIILSLFLTVLAAAAIIAIPSSVQAQTIYGTWNSVISPSAGGTKTSISFYATGNWLTGWTNVGSHQAVGDLSIGLSGLGTSPSNAWTMATTNFTFAPFGYMTNITQGLSLSLTTVKFRQTFVGGPLQFKIGPTGSSVLPVTNGDTLAVVLDATPTELEIDLAFSNFTPGTYNTAGSDPSYQFNMEIVPEPSALSLLAVGLGGLALMRRRRS